jgi:hemoglobin/transferrin/lactoferrin receptor protein
MAKVLSWTLLGAVSIGAMNSAAFAQDASIDGEAIQGTVLDGIIVTLGKSTEAAIDALAGSTSIDRETIDTQFQPDKISDVLRTIPGVTTQETPRDTAIAVNIRGLQDFGRVNVLVEGARQNFQRSGHSANGVFYIDPEMIKRVDVTRGPTATIYGSGAIGGVAAFELIDADDILRAGEYAAGELRTRYGTNGNSKLASGTAAARVGNFDIVSQVNGRWSDDYEDGSGNVVQGSNDETDSRMVKMRFRPADGHQITGTLVDYNSLFVDQTESGGGLFDTEVGNTQYTLGYTFQSPTNPLIDFSSKIYRNETDLGQTRLTGSTANFFTLDSFPGATALSCTVVRTSGPPLAGQTCYRGTEVVAVGSERSFSAVTDGFDVFNTSRFDLPANSSLALTYGVDGFRDVVTTTDPSGSGDEFTPSGERNIYGAFVQANLKFWSIFELIGAVRYDNYELSGGAINVQDDQISPKATLGVTPIDGVTFYATYAEAFRAPALTETLMTGLHPGSANFLIRPNPELRPETAENIEAGVNLKYDNVVTSGDAFRAKATAFRNEIADFIDQVFVEGPIAGLLLSQPFGPPRFSPYFLDDFVQYQNISNALIEGVEFEAYYDARSWFMGIGAHHIRGTNEDTGAGLFSIPADQLTLTVGFRALDEKLTAGTRVRIVGEQDRFIEGDTAATQHADAYNVVDLFAQYEANENLILNANIDNLFDETFRQHLDQFNSPGFNARVGLTMRLGAQ